MYGKKETKEFKEGVYRRRRHSPVLGLYCCLDLVGLELGRLVYCRLERQHGFDLVLVGVESL